MSAGEHVKVVKLYYDWNKYTFPSKVDKKAPESIFIIKLG